LLFVFLTTHFFRTIWDSVSTLIDSTSAWMIMKALPADGRTHLCACFHADLRDISAICNTCACSWYVSTTYYLICVSCGRSPAGRQAGRQADLRTQQRFRPIGRHSGCDLSIGVANRRALTAPWLSPAHSLDWVQLAAAHLLHICANFVVFLSSFVRPLLCDSVRITRTHSPGWSLWGGVAVAMWK